MRKSLLVFREMHYTENPLWIRCHKSFGNLFRPWGVPAQGQWRKPAFVHCQSPKYCSLLQQPEMLQVMTEPGLCGWDHSVQGKPHGPSRLSLTVLILRSVAQVRDLCQGKKGSFSTRLKMIWLSTGEPDEKIVEKHFSFAYRMVCAGWDLP